MKLNLDIPKDLRCPDGSRSMRTSFKTEASNKQSLELTSSGVREKLSSTRQLLEQTLSKKTRPRQRPNKSPDSPDESLHNQLHKPNFEQLNNIYENYLKVPSKQKVQCKIKSYHRSSSAPPVWQKTKEQLLLEKEEKFMQECTFKPNINAIPQSKNLDYTGHKFNRTEWFKNLTRSKNEILEQREKQKREKEEENSKNCSFRPNISSFRSTTSLALPVDERLYIKGDNKQLRRERLKRERDEIDASSFPYSPQVSESIAVIMNDKKMQPPLYQRFYKVQAERAALRQQYAEKKEESEGLTFKPYLSPNSRRLAESRCTGSIFERLSRDNSQYKAPTCENSVSFSSTSTRPYNPKEFVERQELLLKKSQEKKVNRT